MSAWLLPDHIADVLPSEARHIEELRRSLLDAARGYGYELVMPPMLEYLESLLTGTGQALDLQTFKLVDQLSGRTMGLRADTTPQVARIDAHLLNRQSPTRLCYCGPVLHTHPAKPHTTREPLQFGAEVYGHAGLEADLEVLLLAIDCLQRAGFKDLTLDLNHVQVLESQLQSLSLNAEQHDALQAALAAKDESALQELAASLPGPAQTELLKLLPLMHLYGGADVLEKAKKALRPSDLLDSSLSFLEQIMARVKVVQPAVNIQFDLADARGYAYYSGLRFAIYSPQAGDAVARGGRYDEVGSVFGRKRPAVGFSLDIKDLVAAAPSKALSKAILAPWSEDAALRALISQLRTRGEVVVCMLPGHESEIQEFHCDRQLVQAAGQWVVKSI
jgi:ATP phosphoribosyltransferase regulatory subunit